MYSYRVPRVYKLADRFDAVTIIPIINYVSRVLEIEKRKKDRKKEEDRDPLDIDGIFNVFVDIIYRKCIKLIPTSDVTFLLFPLSF